MRRLTALLALVAAIPLLCRAQEAEPIFERTYLSTDKDVYVAGDRIWCSAFCFDAAGKGLSRSSAIAYAELVSVGGEVIRTAKIGLEGGRGSGYIDLPEGMPTGNYRLFAYTAVNRNEADYDFLLNSKVISVLNALNSSKVRNKVSLVSDALYRQRKEAVSPDRECGELDVRVAGSPEQGGIFRVELENAGSSPVSLSVSVYREDSIAAPEDKSICSVRIPEGNRAKYSGLYSPETEGEIIRATLSGRDRERIISDEAGATAFISASSAKGDTYTSLIGRDGSIVFKTNNIYGQRELVTEVADLEDRNLQAVVDISTPFVRVDADVPVLDLCAAIADDVLERGRGMQSFRMEYRDSLAEFTGRKEEFPYRESGALTYDLDDYTRFPTVREVLVEITPEVRVRGRNGKQRIQVLTKDNDLEGAITTSWETSLVLLDGVPVFRHSDMMDYDAMLIKEIQIWRERFVFGNRIFSGIVNFKSVKGNMAFMDFGSNVRIIDFQGICYPMDYTRRHAPEGGVDRRGTIFWKPDLELSAGQGVSLECLAPDHGGFFRIEVEGVTAEGEPVHKVTKFAID